MINFIYINLGVILNLLGTILIALAFGKYPKDGAPYTEEKGEKKYIAYFNYPYLFWLGILFLSVGFLFQLRFK